MSKHLYGLLEPTSNKFIVVSESFTAIKRLQFIIMQKYFFPIANITKTFEYQKIHNVVKSEVDIANINNRTCIRYGLDSASAKSLEQTLSFANAIETCICDSPTTLEVDHNLKNILEVILEILELVEAQMQSIKKFMQETTADRHKGIQEFQKFLTLFVNNEQEHKGLKDIFQQELNLVDMEADGTQDYYIFVTKSLIDIFYKINDSETDPTISFVKNFIELLEYKVTAAERVAFPYLLRSDGFDKFELFADDHVFKEFSSVDNFPEQLKFYMKRKLEQVHGT